MMSKILSRYLPEQDGVCFILASSPSAASMIDLRIIKNAAKKNDWFKINTIANNPETPKSNVT